MINYQVRKCCEDMPHHMYVLKTDKRIDIEADHYFDFQDVKYCMYCGNRLRLEAKPLSPKDRALEELKIEMDTKAVKDYIKAKDL
jgi:hypothetical protein